MGTFHCMVMTYGQLSAQLNTVFIQKDPLENLVFFSCCFLRLSLVYWKDGRVYFCVHRRYAWATGDEKELDGYGVSTTDFLLHAIPAWLVGKPYMPVLQASLATDLAVA